MAWNALVGALSYVRIIPPRNATFPYEADDDNDNGKIKPYVRLNFPMNFVTAPLIADLFLLAILAIGRKEVHDGILGADNISPIDIMAFFITLAYIAISIDASGLIRYLAFKVLQWGGKVGHRLFFFLYSFFFLIGSFIGNDPIVLSGTAFLAYMTRVSSNIVHPRAWIHTQFAVANIASAILVSSNPTNLVLAGAFQIRFINYTANMIVPVVVTVVVLFPFLLYIVFANEALIPYSIEMHELPPEARTKKPVNPNIPHARGPMEEDENSTSNDEQTKVLSLEEIMNPFLDKGGAAFGAVIMAATLITVLVINAVSTGTEAHPVFWVTLPAAFVMFCWDIGFGWFHRAETRQIARRGRLELETAREERALREREQARFSDTNAAAENAHTYELKEPPSKSGNAAGTMGGKPMLPSPPAILVSQNTDGTAIATSSASESITSQSVPVAENATDKHISNGEKTAKFQNTKLDRTTSVSPTPNLFVSSPSGEIPVFAHGWDHWVKKTGTVGAIGGMGFLSIVLCNFAGTNIGTTTLLSRVIQGWQKINIVNQTDISDGTFWATVYSMAIGVNYGAFSTAFSASLTGLLWRDILSRKHTHVQRLEFARVNLPIIAIAMIVGCAVLTGQIYIVRSDKPYNHT
ncbi:Arsenical pump membrane protein, ArsB, partial [Metarhizium majus ARSEF 297]